MVDLDKHYERPNTGINFKALGEEEQPKEEDPPVPVGRGSQESKQQAL